MNSLFNTPVAIVPLRHKITVRQTQMAYLKAKRLARTLLLPPLTKKGGVA